MSDFWFGFGIGFGSGIAAMFVITLIITIWFVIQAANFNDSWLNNKENKKE